MQTITGEQLIGAHAVRGVDTPFRAVDPATGAELAPQFETASAGHVALAASLAWQAFDVYRETTLAQRAALLEAIAQHVAELGAVLIDRAVAETGIPRGRLEGERDRTVNQLRLFAGVVRDGRWLSAAIDTALPARVPPRPDLRLRKIALGPVAVFGASNFPLAFSVAGGDTAAALAAGCPVIVKAHGAHPGTSELVGRAVQRAVADAGLPEGVFSMLQGDGRTVGLALVEHPAIKAVAFTGSRQGGVALINAAARRKEPIPVYAEMSSTNPVFVLPGALAEGPEAIATGFIDSLMLSSGQLCTNPGMVIAVEGAALDAFRVAVVTALEAKSSGPMLTAGIQAAYNAGVAQRGALDGVRLLARSACGASVCDGQAALFETDAANFLAHHELEDEIFGASSLIVRCRDLAEQVAVAESIEGQLTATMFLAQSDHAMARTLLPTLERKVGRILVNGFPTGVEVSHAMVHGGPYPATSDSRTTSVGASAIDRFLRPVSYQNLPAELLPEALREDNPLGLWRVRDGALRQE
ncbi:aldehyde dehydrogenase (NADP(+)) [Duganella aceris]|uniref:Aldehyde dehydrogenase (NADP(+)) n=1 Tax=Duganella aceris TaxID=2703883 RepID=A0ABX0FGQ0_9BURK|nr:aldehyde dehydrogenase (NADP(+)) [Duganella aceris]NGZ83731.1 aldehyde dehydrogenase (NADP(+)) [Duganella aceris]